MVKLQVFYGHPKDPAAFEAYYHDPHTPIALKVPGLRRFEVSKVLGAEILAWLKRIRPNLADRNRPRA